MGADLNIQHVMIKHNPVDDAEEKHNDEHHRRSIRLKNYDYSNAGAYFITICTHNKECLFGKIIDGEMMLNDAGAMVKKWYFELENKFDNVECAEYIVMPNHFHSIINIVGADLPVCPDNTDKNIGEQIMKGEHTGSPLPRIIQWFKTMTTNEYICGVKQQKWKPFDKKLWQRNYYEHVIRNEKELNEIREYIKYNPAKWDEDKENIDR